MGKVPDWISLWGQLAGRPPWSRETAPGKWTVENDPYRELTHHFDDDMKRRVAEPDPIRDFVASLVDGNTTILDIGTGTGRLALFFARRVRKVTAVEPSPSMLAILKKNIAAEGIENVEVVEGLWPDEVRSALAYWNIAPRAY